MKALTGAAFIWILFLSPLFAETVAPVSEEAEPENLTINWKKDDAFPVVSPDGDFLIFSSDRPGAHEDFNFWTSYNKNAADRTGKAVWTVPVPFRLPLSGDASDTMKILHPGGIAEEPGLFTVNTDGFESMASIVWRGGKPVEIYFTSTAQAQGQGFAGLNLYFARFKEDRWSKPVQLSLSSEFDDRMPSVSVDGEWMVFSSNRPGGFGGDDLYLSHRDPKTGKWSIPVNAGPSVNTPYNETSPAWSVDRGTLFFSSDRPGGLGHYDFYLSRLRGDALQPAENLGRPFNSERDDEGISFTEDRMWMYFASDRRTTVSQGGLDLYRFRIPDWIRDPVDVLFSALIMDSSTRLPLGVEATVKIEWPQGSITRQSSKFNKGEDPKKPNFEQTLITGREYRVVISAPGFYPQELLLDYRGNVPPGKKDQRTVLLEPVKDPGQIDELTRLIPGRIVDAQTELPLSGTRLRRMVKGVSTPIATDAKGGFQIRLKKGETVSLRADAPAHTGASMDVTESKDLREIVIRLAGEGDPCKENSPACIDNIRILFALGSAGVSPDEQKKLDAIVRILKANPDLKMEVRGHTDRTYRGAEADSYKYNLMLSEMRAKNVRDLLVKAGIEPARITLKPVAYLEPEAPETSDKARSRNRRVEFRRLNLEK